MDSATASPSMVGGINASSSTGGGGTNSPSNSGAGGICICDVCEAGDAEDCWELPLGC